MVKSRLCGKGSKEHPCPTAVEWIQKKQRKEGSSGDRGAEQRLAGDWYNITAGYYEVRKQKQTTTEVAVKKKIVREGKKNAVKQCKLCGKLEDKNWKRHFTRQHKSVIDPNDYVLQPGEKVARYWWEQANPQQSRSESNVCLGAEQVAVPFPADPDNRMLVEYTKQQLKDGKLVPRQFREYGIIAVNEMFFSNIQIASKRKTTTQLEKPSNKDLEGYRDIFFGRVYDPVMIQKVEDVAVQTAKMQKELLESSRSLKAVEGRATALQSPTSDGHVSSQLAHQQECTSRSEHRHDQSSIQTSLIHSSETETETYSSTETPVNNNTTAIMEQVQPQNANPKESEYMEGVNEQRATPMHPFKATQQMLQPSSTLPVQDLHSTVESYQQSPTLALDPTLDVIPQLLNDLKAQGTRVNPRTVKGSLYCDLDEDMTPQPDMTLPDLGNNATPGELPQPSSTYQMVKKLCNPDVSPHVVIVAPVLTQMQSSIEANSSNRDGQVLGEGTPGSMQVDQELPGSETYYCNTETASDYSMDEKFKSPEKATVRDYDFETTPPKKSNEKIHGRVDDPIDESAKKLKQGIAVYRPQITDLFNRTLKFQLVMNKVMIKLITKKGFKHINNTNMSRLAYTNFCKEVQVQAVFSRSGKSILKQASSPEVKNVRFNLNTPQATD